MSEGQMDPRKFRHDILGCLNSIRLSMEAAQMAPDRAEVGMFLDYIGAEVNRAQTLIDKLVPPKAKVSPFKSSGPGIIDSPVISALGISQVEN